MTLSVDQDSLAMIRPELTPGETLLWAARPRDGFVFHWNENEPQVLFSLIWGVFAIVWETFAIFSLWFTPPQIGGSILMILVGIPVVAMGQYLIWGRFHYAAWKKKRTYYAVTDRHVIVVHNYRERKVASAEIGALQVLLKEKYSGDIGTIRFCPPPPLAPRTWSEMWTLDRNEPWDPLSIKRGPVFEDVENVDAVYQLISALRAKTTEVEVARILRDRQATHTPLGSAASRQSPDASYRSLSLARTRAPFAGR